ncbi:hypothetical protein PSN45_002052 [Yamadazyma tenuis]|nr:hypothetical protein PSN45_002052 [Yamadazyma tenuis]
MQVQILHGIKTFIGVVHGPAVAAVALTAVGSYIHVSQLIQLHNHPEDAQKLDANDYAWDIYSSVLNLVFLTRFALNTQLNVAWESVLLVVQFGFLAHNVLTLGIVLTWSWVSVLYYLQIVCPAVMNVINILDYFRGHMGVTHLMVNFNNNILPVLLTNSFMCINLSFKVYYDTWTMTAYRLLENSLKIYCLYQYILYELFNQFEDEFLPYEGHSRQDYFLVVTLIMQVVYDGGTCGR